MSRNIRAKNGHSVDEAIEHYLASERRIDGVVLAAYAWANREEFIEQYNRWIDSYFRYKIEID